MPDVYESPLRPPLQVPPTRIDLDTATYNAIMNATLPVAARCGGGFEIEDIRTIARTANVYPDLPIFADPEALYAEALYFAHQCIWPSSKERLDRLELDSTPVVTALRSVIESTFRRFRDNPAAVRLIIADNLYPGSGPSGAHRFLKDSPVVLALDRLLIRGHEAGAFRQGVSSEDLYVLILSLCSFAVAHGPTFHTLYGMNAQDPVNDAGLCTLTCDATLAFLTTTMPTAQGSSYTHASAAAGYSSSVAAGLYSVEGSEAADAEEDSGAANFPSPSDVYDD